VKASLEKISFQNEGRSIQFFKVQEKAFAPFWHYHPEIELTFISRGEGTRFIGDSIASYKSHDLVLVGENLPHHWVSIENKEIEFQEAFIFQFPLSAISWIKEAKSLNGLFEQSKRGLHFYKPNKDIIDLVTRSNHQNPLAILGGLLQILDLLSKENQVNYLSSENFVNRKTKKIDHDKFTFANNYILEHIDQKLTVDLMAQMTHFAPQSFCRWFKANSGLSFISFLNLARVQRAKHILNHTQQPIQEIAFEVGFENVTHFNRVFKKLENLSPRQYRNNSVI